MFVTEGAMQFNLVPTSDHEKEMMNILNKFQGNVTIQKGSDIGMCHGNYVRNFGGNNNALTITINKPELKATNE